MARRYLGIRQEMQVMYPHNVPPRDPLQSMMSIGVKTCLNVTKYLYADAHMRLPIKCRL